LPKDQAQPVMTQEHKPIEYTYAALKSTHRQFHFSGKEIEHLALATMLVVGVGLSLDFAGNANGGYLLLALSTVAFTVSFLVHEIAHKIVAQKHGLWAEFRLTLMGAVLTAISIPLPFKFISPGAVMVAGAADRKTMGKTAVAGPCTNIVLATILSAAAAAWPSYAFSFGVIAWFNAWIAVINLIPFGIFDGMKVFVWNKIVWALTFAVSAAFTVVLTITFLG
jgi:Zn-dependent protease